MKKPKILLIYPPNQLMQIETPRPDGSLGPLYLAGALEVAGFPVDILDASVGTSTDKLGEIFFRSVMQQNGLIRIGMTMEEISEFIASGNYNIVGINSNFTPQTRMALEVARAAKNVSPEILVVAGGVNARNLPGRFLETGNVDVICLTEGEIILTRLVQAWSLDRSFVGISGIALFQDNEVKRISTDPNDVCQDLDRLPMPRWDKSPLDIYEQLTSPHAVITGNRERYASIMISRGCPFHCAYCHISVEKASGLEVGDIGSYRVKSLSRVLEEIAELQRLGISKVFFEDDSLLANKTRVQQIFTAIRSHGLQIADVNGVNLVHLQRREGNQLIIDIDYLELLRTAGLNQIVFPVESASQRILDKYATAKLHHDRLNVVELVKLATKVGILCPVNMMIGFPDETETEIRSSIALGKQLVEAGSPYCTFFIPIPFPGSQLYEIAIRGGHLDVNFDPDLFNWKNAVMKNTVVPPERVLELRDWGWRHANTQEHVRARLEASAGNRWQAK
jgi:radical SAM superfamily enzyme YgiQ (UPF0313 family)